MLQYSYVLSTIAGSINLSENGLYRLISHAIGVSSEKLRYEEHEVSYEDLTRVVLALFAFLEGSEWVSIKVPSKSIFGKVWLHNEAWRTLFLKNYTTLQIGSWSVEIINPDLIKVGCTYVDRKTIESVLSRLDSERELKQ